MFLQTGAVLPAGVTSPKIEFIDNAILESFAIHLRNLLDFFYPGDRPKPDDIIAAYYYDAGRLPSNFPQKSDALNKAEMRAHKQVSHLTTKRVSGDDPEKAWYVAPLMSEVAKLLLAFLAGASRDRLAREFVERTKTALNHLQTQFATASGDPAPR